MVRCRLTRGAQPLRHRLRDATSPTEGMPWHSAKLCLLARGSPIRGAVERSETERLDEGQPDREALAKLNLSVIAYAMPPPLPRGGLGIPQSFASSPEAPLLGELANEVRLRGCTKDSLTGKLLLNSTSPSRLTPCHLPYRGEALAFRKALPLRQRLPY